MPGLYELEAVVGVGSFATVALARRTADGARVALKVLRGDLVHDASLLARMKDEARVLSTLDLPGVVRVFALHDYGDRRVLEMEAVNGPSLGAALRNGRTPLPASEALQVTWEVANALHGAYHAPSGLTEEPLRVVHRDVKPDNLLVDTRTGHVKLVDFGLAKADLAERAARTVGILLGSAGFEAPEQRIGMATPASDVYALGVTLFTLISDRTLMLPNKEERRTAELERQLGMVFGDLTPGGAASARELLASMVAGDPSARPSAAHVAATIATLLKHETPPDLTGWLAKQPAPKPAVPAREHPAWQDLAFLESELPTEAPRRSHAEAESEIARLLMIPGWPGRLPEIERALLSSSERAEGPLLEVLARAQLPWWQFWKKAAPPDEIQAALWVLASRPSNHVLRYARTLANHPIPGVSRCARLVIERAAAG